MVKLFLFDTTFFTNPRKAWINSFSLRDYSIFYIIKYVFRVRFLIDLKSQRTVLIIRHFRNQTHTSTKLAAWFLPIGSEAQSTNFHCRRLLKGKTSSFIPSVGFMWYKNAKKVSKNSRVSIIKFSFVLKERSDNSAIKFWTSYNCLLEWFFAWNLCVFFTTLENGWS